MAPSERVSARVLDGQLDSNVRGERFEDSSYIFNQGIAGPVCRCSPGRFARGIVTYLQRLSQAAPRLDAMIAESRQRGAKGIVPSKFIPTATIGQIRGGEALEGRHDVRHGEDQLDGGFFPRFRRGCDVELHRYDDSGGGLARFRCGNPLGGQG